MSTEVLMASLPDCDICSTAGDTIVATYDGKTQMGPWAYMCEQHFAKLGVGLGTGRGQRLILASTRCAKHPAFEPDNCPGCGTQAKI